MQLIGPLGGMRPVPYLFVGGPSVIAGIALLLASPLDHYAAFAGALVAGGLALVWLGGSGRRIGWVGWLACGVLAVTGLFASRLIVREDVQCMFCYHRGQGYPWGWLDTDFTDADMPTVERAHQIMATHPEFARPTLDGFKVVLDTVFWAYVALPLIVVLTQINSRDREAR